MLTRIEIDGFKTFEDFSLDLGPFTVILGPNASGKSNLFDAIRLVSNLASQDLRKAFRDLRGEVQELFRRGSGAEISSEMRFAVEVLVDPRIEDPWGREADLDHTRIRYELVIRRIRNDRGLERLIVARERASPIFVKDDRWQRQRRISRSFRQHFLRTKRRTDWLVTEDTEEGNPQFKIRPDGRGGRPFPAQAAEATVLSTITTGEFPHLYALRNELRSWRLLQLNPAALRRASPAYGVAEELEADGGNLAYVLARIAAETADDLHPQGRLPAIAAELASIIPGVVNLEVYGEKSSGFRNDELRDHADREYRVELSLRNGLPFSARVVSDGTLRVLALLTVLHDPLHRGLILFEEPENGIHPARLQVLIHRLRELVTDPAEEPLEAPQPLSQLVMNSHSPVLLSALTSDSESPQADVVFADLVTTVDPTRKEVRPKTRMRPILATDQGKLVLESDEIGRFEVQAYLSNVNRSGI